jgi:hypothetical protein
VEEESAPCIAKRRQIFCTECTPELRRQLEILGLERFRREVMPPDWRDRLRDTALALATPNQLLAMLERKCSSSKATGAALKSVKKSLRPTT